MSETKTEELEGYRIQNAPPSMFYIPNFITADEEAYILNKASMIPTFNNQSMHLLTCIQIPPNKWISLSHRRLQAVPARLTASNALIASTGLPEWLSKPVLLRFRSLGLFQDSPHGSVNHCLINEYLPGQGIMPHEDGAAYYPVVATVSLGGSIVLDVTEKIDHTLTTDTNGDTLTDRKSWRILQEPRSLLVTTGSAYQDTLHGIAEVHEDTDLNEQTVANWSLLGNKEDVVANGGRVERTTRISLTYRDVLKVSNISSKIFGRPKS